MTALDDLALIEDLAPLLGVAPSTLREWCRRGRFPHVKLPGTRRILCSYETAAAYLAGADLEMKQLADGGRLVEPKQGRNR